MRCRDIVTWRAVSGDTNGYRKRSTLRPATSRSWWRARGAVLLPADFAAVKIERKARVRHAAWRSSSHIGARYRGE